MANLIIEALRSMPHDLIAVYVEQDPAMIGNSIRIIATRAAWASGTDPIIPRDSSEIDAMDIKMTTHERVPDVVKVYDCDLMPDEIDALVVAAAKYCGAIDVGRFGDKRSRRWLFKQRLPVGHPLRDKAAITKAEGVR